MSTKRKTVLAGLAITLVFMLACHNRKEENKNKKEGNKEEKFLSEPPPGSHHGQEDNRVFRVYIYTDPDHHDQCLADWPIGTIWNTKHQTVVWVSDDGAEYTVDFTQGHHPAPLSPFASPTFDVPKNGEKPSGDLSSGATGYYDFAIHAGNSLAKETICKQTGDPGLIVKP